MANKRELKKYITDTCGAMAADMIMTGYIFPEINPDAVENVISRIAAVQADALAKCSTSYDKVARDFETPSEYHKARRAYFAAAYSRLLKDFNAQVGEIVKEMNAALPESVKAAFKKAAAE